MKKILFFLVLTLLTIASSYSHKKDSVLTLNQAVNLAHKHRPSLKAFKFATQVSKHEEKKALSGYLPTVTITDNPAFATASRGLQNSVSVQATQLVYSFAGPLESYKIAKKGTDISKLSEQEHEDLVRFQVESAFLQSWLFQKKDELIKTLNESTTKILKKAEHQKELNLLGKNEWLKETSSFAKNIANVYLYTNQLDNAHNKLEYLIGKPLKNDQQTLKLEWCPKKEIKLQTLESYYQKAIKNRKEIKQNQKAYEQQEEYQNFYKNSYLPSVSISGNAGRSGGTGSGSIGATISWNIFDGGSNFHNKNKANANKLKALMEKDSNIQKVKFEVQAAYNKLSENLKQLVGQKADLVQAQNEFELKKQRFDIGDLSKVDLETEKYIWEVKKFEWLTLKVDATIKERELYYACGYPDKL